jgi:hypothetical protein
MSTRQQFRRSINETDEEIPSLQSPSDSSEGEDEPTPQPLPTQQHTIPPLRPLAADAFDSDDSDMDITESGTVA